MVGIRRLKLVLGISTCLFCFSLMSHNVFAASPLITRNIISLDVSYNNSTLRSYSINGGVNTEIIQDFSQDSFYLSKPDFSLNGIIQLNNKRYARFTLEISSAYYSGVEFYVQCPQGDYNQNFYVVECQVRDVDNHIISWTGEQKFLYNQGNGVVQSQIDNTSPSSVRKTYFMDLLVTTKSSSLIDFSHLPFLGRFINYYKSSSLSIFAYQLQLSIVDKVSVFNISDLDLISNIQSQTSDMNTNFTQILNKMDELISAQEESQQQEQNAVDSIENQSPSDIGNSDSNQTTSIIGTVSSFVSAFSNISPSSNCNVLLEFPDYMGGNQTVNICQGKDKAPAIVSIGSSLLLIITFVPLAFIMLRMIYNEIRSFTNG